jgi:hypothetical protein
MRMVRSGNFWIGVVVGAVAVPIVLGRFAPGLKAKLPS